MRFSFAVLTMIVAMMLNFMIPVSTLNAQEISPDTIIYIVEDKTVESGCTIWYDDDRDSAEPCEPLSYFSIRQSLYNEALNDKTLNYIVATGDNDKDAKAAGNLIISLRGHGLHANACTAVTGRKISALYGASGATILVEVRYDVNTSCVVSNIQDRTQQTGTTSVRCWRDTGIGSSYIRRDAFFTLTWSPWLLTSGLTSSVGGTYQNIANNDFLTPCNSMSTGSLSVGFIN